MPQLPAACPVMLLMLASHARDFGPPLPELVCVGSFLEVTFRPSVGCGSVRDRRHGERTLSVMTFTCNTKKH